MLEAASSRFSKAKPWPDKLRESPPPPYDNIDGDAPTSQGRMGSTESTSSQTATTTTTTQNPQHSADSPRTPNPVMGPKQAGIATTIIIVIIIFELFVHFLAHARNRHKQPLEVVCRGVRRGGEEEEEERWNKFVCVR